MADDAAGRPGARWLGLFLVAAATAFLIACTQDGDPPAAAPTTTTEPDAQVPVVVARQGGMTTAFDDTELAFAHPARSLSLDGLRQFAAGDETFEASLTTAEGLGPTFDAVGCTSCHVNDGRGPGPDGDGPLPTGMIARLDTDDTAAATAYGPQLELSAVEGRGPEARILVHFEELHDTYADGTPYALRSPTYEVMALGPSPLPDDAVLSVRNAPPLIGLGLLGQIASEDLQAHTDPDDADGNGISGRLGHAVVPFREEPVIGRFGWQASAATVEHQIALALIHDMGVTTSWFPLDACQQDTSGCPRPAGPVTERFGSSDAPVDLPLASSTEMDDRTLFDLTVYTLAVAVPAIRDVDDPQVQRGAELFQQVGCSSCHAGPFTTTGDGVRGLSGQVIDPGTDLLLYDMGPGLADRRLDGDRVVTEWRAAPLWGLGLADVVLGRPARYLHDGRARTVAEAILWHGGEGEPAREHFRQLSRADREALLAYLAAR